ATVILGLTFQTREIAVESHGPAETARQVMLQLLRSPPTLPYVP
ncbi:MAG: hypothetical protein JWQ81_6891, partial [Amycolatopsis sp.]|nr:hypothetical protein [Amycolatopsis sp.]